MLYLFKINSKYYQVRSYKIKKHKSQKLDLQISKECLNMILNKKEKKFHKWKLDIGMK
jgi:hypothetical protein